MALCARNAHITVYDVTTWSWVNLVNPTLAIASLVHVASFPGSPAPERDIACTTRVPGEPGNEAIVHECAIFGFGRSLYGNP